MFRAKGGLLSIVDVPSLAPPDANSLFPKQLQQSTAKFVGGGSISAATACSDTMRDFILGIIRISHAFFTTHQLFNPEEIVTKFVPKSMRSEIKALSDRVTKTFWTVWRTLSLLTS